MPSLKEMAQSTRAKKEKVVPKEKLNPMGETWQVEYIHSGGCMTCDNQEFISQYNGTCVVCDRIMTQEGYNNRISENKVLTYHEIIHNQTGYTFKEIEKLVEDKREELKGLISEEGALFVITKDLGVELRSEAEVKKEQNDQDMFNDDITEIEVVEKPKSKTKPKSKPKTKQPKKVKETKKYPLKVIPIEKGQLSDPLILEDAKQRILNDIHLYNFTIENIVNNDDSVLINGKEHLCKSGVRKIQLALNISTEIIEEDIHRLDGVWVAKYRVRASAPSGRFAEAIGACVQDEKGRSRTYHDTLATAETRATSRSVMNLVGWGSVTSEEINDVVEDSGDLF